jgi:hypothetical protein
VASISRAGKILSTVLCGILATCYFVVFYLMLKPHVSRGYRSYYIDRSTTLTPFQQEKADRELQDPVVKVAFDDPDARFTGWNPPEDGFNWRWNADETASVEFQLPTDANPRGILAISACYPRHEQRQIHIYLNGMAIITYHSLNTPWDLLVDIDRSLLKPGQLNTLTFKFPDARPPDYVPLAVALQAVEIY